MLEIHNAIIQRIGRYPNYGIYSVPVADGVQVLYNKLNRTHTLIDMYAQWADGHDGKLLLPLSTNGKLGTIEQCNTYVGVTEENEWIMGHIHACGAPWKRGVTTLGEYTTPTDFLLAKQRFWLALERVEHGSDFDFSQWVARANDDSVLANTLETLWNTSKAPTIYAYREVEVDK